MKQTRIDTSHSPFVHNQDIGYKRLTFAGIRSVNTQVFAPQEGMGPISIASEHLGTKRSRDHRRADESG